MNLKEASRLGLAQAAPVEPIDIVEMALREARLQIENFQRENEILGIKARAFDTLERLTRVNYGGEMAVSSTRSFPWYIDDALFEIERARNENAPGENLEELDASDIVGHEAGTVETEKGDSVDTITLFKEAMGEFCNKVEAGQIKSRHTYVKFCRLLGRPTFFDHIGDESCERAEPGQPAPATKA